MIRSKHWTAITFQLLHIFLSVAWNLAGVYLQAIEEQPLGPTASFSTVMVLIGLAALLLISVNRRLWLYLCVSTVLLLGAVSAIHGGIVKPSSLWPSEAWRFAGIVVNLIGVVGFILAARMAVRRQRGISG